MLITFRSDPVRIRDQADQPAYPDLGIISPPIPKANPLIKGKEKEKTPRKPTFEMKRTQSYKRKIDKPQDNELRSRGAPRNFEKQQR